MMPEADFFNFFRGKNGDFAVWRRRSARESFPL